MTRQALCAIRASVCFCIAAAAAGPVLASAPPSLMIPDEANARVMTFNLFDGSVANLNFITGIGGTLPSSPIEAIAVGSEVWVTDNRNRAVWRYDWNGAAVPGSFSVPGLSSPRGIATAGNTVYVADPAAAGGKIHTFDLNGNNTGSFPATSPRDVTVLGGTLYAADSGFGGSIQAFSLAGAPLGQFNTTPFNNYSPEQVSVRPSTLGLMAATNQGISNQALFDLSAAGATVGTFGSPSQPVSGIWELGNGNIMYTKLSTSFPNPANGSVNIYDVHTGVTTAVVTGINPQYVGLLPGPGALGVALLAGVTALRRRR